MLDPNIPEIFALTICAFLFVFYVQASMEVTKMLTQEWHVVIYLVNAYDDIAKWWSQICFHDWEVIMLLEVESKQF